MSVPGDEKSPEEKRTDTVIKLVKFYKTIVTKNKYFIAKKALNHMRVDPKAKEL